MAPLYSRYIPPKKSKEPIEQPHANLPNEGSSAKNALYARYVPPKKLKTTIPLDEPPETLPVNISKSESKKRKRSKAGAEIVKSEKSRKTEESTEKRHKTRAFKVAYEDKAGPATESEEKDGNDESDNAGDEYTGEEEYDSYLPAGEDAPVEPWREVVTSTQWDENDDDEVDVNSIFAKYSASGGVNRIAAPDRQEDTNVIGDQSNNNDAPGGADAVFAKYRKSLSLSQKRSKREEGNATNKEASPELELHDLVPLPQPERAPKEPYRAQFSSLPSWISNPRTIGSDTSISFDNLPLSDRLSRNLARKNLSTATAVQTAVLPLLLPGKENHRGDVCVSAPTGSGKTLSYVLPMIESMIERPMKRLRGIIVVPTRELVTQAREIAEICAMGTGVRIGTAVGSVALAVEQTQLVKQSQRWDLASFGFPREETTATKMRREADQRIKLGYDKDDELLASITHLLPNHIPEYNSNVDILICTPGRLVDHIRSTLGFTLRYVEWLVIDEADRLLDQNFQDWVDLVLPAMESGPALGTPSARDGLLATLKDRVQPKNVQKVILSATMTRDLSKLANLRLNRPTLVAVVDPENSRSQGDGDINHTDGTAAVLPSGLTEYAVPVGDGSEKPLYALGLLQSRLDILGEESEDTNVLIFCSSDDNATRLAHLLSTLAPSFGSQTATLTKSTTAADRRKLLKSFRKGGKLRVLLSTDRASRGLDVEDLTYVVNYDVPPSITSYVHRVGRTARAGKKGTTWTLYTDKEARWFWKVVAGGKDINRGDRIVERVKIREGAITDDLKEEYQSALEELGDAVRGR